MRTGVRYHGKSLVTSRHAIRGAPQPRNRPYAAIAGVTIPKGISFHLLRHTAGQRMSDVGLGIEEAQRVLGHRNPTTTQVYYRVSDKRLRKAIRRLRY